MKPRTFKLPAPPGAIIWTEEEDGVCYPNKIDSWCLSSNWDNMVCRWFWLKSKRPKEYICKERPIDHFDYEMFLSKEDAIAAGKKIGESKEFGEKDIDTSRSKEVEYTFLGWIGQYVYVKCDGNICYQCKIDNVVIDENNTIHYSCCSVSSEERFIYKVFHDSDVGETVFVDEAQAARYGYKTMIYEWRF